MSKALTAPETARKKQLETVIKNGVEGFVAVGNALSEINENRLYRNEYPTFEEYVEKKWELGKSQAYRLMTSASIAVSLSEKSDVSPPKREAHVAPLSKLAPEERPAAWKEAKDTAPEGKVTAKVVEAVVAIRQGSKEAPPPRSGPPPAVVKPKDKTGKAITDAAVVKAFADDTLNEIGRRIDAIRRDIEAIEGNPHLRAQQIAQDLQNAKNAVRFAAPYAVCRKHDGKKCKPCAGCGWLPKDVHDRLEASK